MRHGRIRIEFHYTMGLLKNDAENRTATLDKIDKKKSCKSFDLQDFAEREGFEPPVPLSTPVFKTGAFDHSAISPWSKSECKGTGNF